MQPTLRFRPAVAFGVGAAVAVVATLSITQAWQVDAAPGDEDATFVPIDNCRLFDTRPAPDNIGPKNTPIGPGDANAMVQQVTGTNGNCTIPDDAVGVAMNVTALNATEPSNVRVFPAGIATPLAANINVRPGAAPTPNKVDVKLSPDGKVTVFNRFGSVDAIGDVVGYYSSASLQELGTSVQELETAVAELQTAADVSGLVPFNFTLADGESEVFGETGALSFEATCTDLGGGDIDAVIHARTTEDDQVVMDSDDDSFDGSGGFLLPATAAADREMFSNNSTLTSVENYIDGGFILSASGEYLAIDGETVALGVNYNGTDCIFAGTYTFATPDAFPQP